MSPTFFGFLKGGMLSHSILAGKLIETTKLSPPSRENLAVCCGEILKSFDFESVFIARSDGPELIPDPVVCEGPRELMEATLYRLGVEERTSLIKLRIKAYGDITGKPVFNQSGSLRIQKPSGGVILVHSLPREDYLMVGCLNKDPRPYDKGVLEALGQVWKSWAPELASVVRDVVWGGSGSASTAPKKAEDASPAGAGGLRLMRDPARYAGFPGDQDRPTPSAPVGKTPPPSSTRVEAPVPAPAASVLDSPAKDILSLEDVEVKEERRRPVILVDEVTRLFNRDYFEECLAIEVERAKRYSRSVSLLFLGVSPVKDGNPAPDPDRTANLVAEVLSKSLRRVDVLCRLEAELYALILPDTSDNTYGIIAKRIFKYFKQLMGDRPGVYLNISAATYPKHADGHAALIRYADKLLDEARQVGPNKAVLPE